MPHGEAMSDDDAFEEWIKWELQRPFRYVESVEYIRTHPDGDFTSWESELIGA
jgi:hypothetical protein